MSRRIILTAPKSGSGKTMVTCGLLKALQNRGMRVKSYKCGPDYIDTMFHKYVLGIEGGNLDSYFSGAKEIQSRLWKETKQEDIAVIEGVMGYYDGLGGNTTAASTYDIARITDTPAVLVVDGKGMGLSMGALIKGFREFRKDSRLAGVIANRANPAMESRFRQCAEESGCLFFGCLPERKEWAWESRHLGLMMPQEMEGLRETIERLSEGVEQYLDVDGLLKLSEGAGDLSQAVFEEQRIEKKKQVKIAVAKDEAFCFYYQENLHMLEALGAELEAFSPMRDKGLPENTDGILFGGGYPELYAKTLSENHSMREAVREMAEKGMPIIGECGGFLYLQEELEGEDGFCYPMAGVLKGKSSRQERLVRFGYGELTAGDDSLFLKPGERIKGHEFHYWDSTDNGNVFRFEKPGGKRSWNCIQRKKNTEGGFPHLYYLSAPAYAEGFIEKCREYRRQKE